MIINILLYHVIIFSSVLGTDNKFSSVSIGIITMSFINKECITEFIELYKSSPRL